MRAKVLIPCIDKYTGEFYQTGRVLDVTPERATEMTGFVEVLDAPVEEPVEKPKRSRKK